MEALAAVVVIVAVAVGLVAAVAAADPAVVRLDRADLQDQADLQDLQGLADLRDPVDRVVVAVMEVPDRDRSFPEEDWINMDMTKDGLILIYKSVCFHLDKWSGGDPREQVALQETKNDLFRILLAQQFKNPTD